MFAALARSGREIAFSIAPAGDPPFDRRLVLPANARGNWIVLTYRSSPRARPLRPMIRMRRAGGASEDVVLPGDACGSAHWLGFLPHDLDAVFLAAGPDLVLERVGLRGRLGLRAEAGWKSPARLALAGYAWLRRDERRTRNTLRALCATTPMPRYAAWKARRQRPPEADAPTSDLSIRLVLASDGSQAAGVAETIDGLKTQTHPHWTLLVMQPGAEDATPPMPGDPRIAASTRNEAATLRSLLGDAGALGFLRPGDVLAPDALAILAQGLDTPEKPDLIYADEESAGTAPRPRLKPDWSPDLALATGYQGVPTLFSRRLCDGLADRPIDERGLTLSAVSAARRVSHIPRVLCRRRASEDDLPARETALGRHLREIGAPATARIADGVLDLHWPRPDPPPLVSVVVPTRDRPDLIGRVTGDVLGATGYPALELVIVDNGSTDPATLRLYDRLAADPRVRIAPYPHPFDFSAMTNAGVRASRGSVLVLINNDVAVLGPDWLDALVAQAVRPEVGAVGAKLLYPDGRLQHAGVVVGLGGRAGHILRRRPGDAPGHLGRMRVAHEVSAVTAACLAVERAKYDAVGGLDAATFPIDFNDVDLCLRLAAAGWKTVWTPKAVLTHRESVSRGPPVGAARRRFEREAEAFAERWRDTIRHDPYYHPALSLTSFGEDLE